MIKQYPHYKLRTIKKLDGFWDFSFVSETASINEVDVSALSFCEKMAVPGVFDAVGTHAGKRGVVAYKTYVNSTPGKSSLLVFHGIGLQAKVFVDRQAVYAWSLPYSEFTVPIAPSTEERREIVVLIDNRFNTTVVPLAHQFYDFYFFGGFYRGVEWHEIEEYYIDRAKISVIDAQAGKIKVAVTINGDSPPSLPVQYSLNNLSIQAAGPQKIEKGMLFLEFTIPNPILWHPHAPHLYELTIQIGNDAVTERFGLREIATDGTNILINSKAIKLLGYCRHETHPQFGPALPDAQLIQDLQLLKKMGCNFIRGSHYPQDQRFLDLCDEMGMVVFEESLGWGNRPAQINSEPFICDQKKQTRLMVQKSFNHPSVIMWGFLNEGSSDDPSCRHLYESLATLIRKEDSSRLITYASMFPHKDINFDLVDIVSVNLYPGWYAADREQTRPLNEIVPALQKLIDLVNNLPKRKPLIISEIGAGAIYGWRDVMHAHWSEEYQSDYLEVVCREVVRNNGYAGLSLWQFCDGRTYSSSYALVRPRAMNNKGTFDEYRRPKLAYEKVKKHFSQNK